MFLFGIVLLHLNPFWHFDTGGVLDHRLEWWNVGAEVLAGAGLLTLALAIVGTAALIVSLGFKRRSWPYLVAAIFVATVVAWATPHGLTRVLQAHFEWNAADGFTTFRLQERDGAESAWSPIWQLIVGLQIRPVLSGFFKMNDWEKMNGDVDVEVIRILPAAWPVGLGHGGETLQDPDETALMRAAAEEDLPALKRLLSSATTADVNALDQNGQTALIYACQNPTPKPDVVKALLAAGAEVNVRSRSGYTALAWARVRNNREISRLLQQAGARL